MNNNIEKDRQSFIEILSADEYDREKDISEYCRLCDKYPAPYPHGFLNDDVLEAMSRLEKRLFNEETDEETGQLSFFDQW